MKKTAPLPKDRIKPAPPFTNVGLDFAGPGLHLSIYLRSYPYNTLRVSEQHDCGAVSPCLKTNGGKKRNVQYYLVR